MNLLTLPGHCISLRLRVFLGCNDNANSACRKFTPILKSIYDNLKSKQRHSSTDEEDFEIVYCSLDNYTSEYNAYALQMPWWCLPHQSPVVDKLRTLYKAEGIPYLSVIDKDGNLLCGDAVNEAMEDPEGARFPWRCAQSIEEILPDTYVQNDGSYHNTKELDEKYLMLYFSAGWCNKSVAFTRTLTKAYTKLKQTRDDFEVWRTFCNIVCSVAFQPICCLHSLAFVFLSDIPHTTCIGYLCEL